MYDFFAKYLEVALKAKLSVKLACIFMTTQLPKEVYQKAKDWLREQPENMVRKRRNSICSKDTRTLFREGNYYGQGSTLLRPRKSNSNQNG